MAVSFKWFKIQEFEWDEKKNSWLKENRGISFEDVVHVLKEGKALAFQKDRRLEQYPNQYLLVVEIKGYPWVVPCEFRGNKLRLITAYPSRKFKNLLRGHNERG